MEAFVPDKTAGKVGPAGNACKQEAGCSVVLRPVWTALDGVAVKVGNSRDKVAEACTGNSLPFGREGGHGENLVKSCLEVLTASGDERIDFLVRRLDSRGCRLSEEGVCHATPEGFGLVLDRINDNGEREG